MYLYLNGVEHDYDASVKGMEGNLEDLLVGKLYPGSSTNNYFDGLIDDVRIYNSSLTAAEVLAVYNSANVVCVNDNDCNTDYAGTDYCYNDDLYHNWHDFSCDQGTCNEATEQRLTQDCGTMSCVGNQCQDVSSDQFNIIFSQNLEQHTDAPMEYTLDLFTPDWNGATWRNSDHRWPECWAAKEELKDWIVIDPLSGSKVIRFSMDDDVCDGYDGQGSFRGGDSWMAYFDEPEPKEVYFSYNIMFKPGFEWSQGGKMPGVSGGTYFVEGTGDGPYRPFYGEGFNANIMFFHSPQGTITWYNYYQDKIQDHPYGELRLWEDFTPEGENMNYMLGPHDKDLFYFDVTEPTWYNIGIRCVVNTFDGTTPVKNGILEGYVNGKLVSQWDGLYLLTYPDRDKGIRLFIRSFIGGGGPPLRDEWTYIDDFVVWTYDESVDVPRGNELSPGGRVLTFPPEADIGKIYL
jgi:hypothetical protein